MNTNEHLGVSAFHKVMLESDSIYQKFQKFSGLSDAEFWSFVAIRLGHCKHQHEICSSMLMSKQTVNTALKQLVKKGFIKQSICEENQRIKDLSITKEGEAFAQSYVDIVGTAEQAAWKQLSLDEQHTLLTICHKLNQFLDIETEKMTTSPLELSKDL